MSLAKVVIVVVCASEGEKKTLWLSFWGPQIFTGSYVKNHCPRGSSHISTSQKYSIFVEI